ncbi:O-antigen ligase [Candidatus Pelagibacter ubique]|nr:O-antigen ligase [Candidatus Pelagibacter ubique]
MEEFLFLFLYISLPVFWLILLNNSGVKILTISIPSFLIISILIYQYLGYPILFFFINDYSAKFVQDREIIWKIFLLSSFTITFIIIGMVAAGKTFGPLHFKNQFNPNSNLILLDKQLSRYFIYLLFIISMFIFYIYLSKVGWNNIALFSIFNLTDQSSSIKELRSNMGNAFEGKYHWYRLFMRDFLSISSLALFGQYLIRKKYFYFLIFVLSFLVSLLSILSATEKSPALWYFISLVLMYLIIKNDSRLKLKHLIGLGIFATLLLGLIYVYFMNAPNLIKGIEYTFSRLTTGQIQGLYHYFTIFPNQVDFLFGKSFPNPGGLMPFEPYALSKEVYNIIFSSKDNKGIVGSMPTFYWGEMYANFGYLGVILPPFFIGYLLYLLNFIILKLPMTPITLSFYVYLILHYDGLAITSLSKFLIDIKIVLVFFIYVFVVSIPNKGIIKYFNSQKQKA